MKEHEEVKGNLPLYSVLNLWISEFQIAVSNQFNVRSGTRLGGCNIIDGLPTNAVHKSA